MFSIGLLITSLWTIIMGYSLVLLWNWVPEKPPVKPPLPPSLDYIHLISCKILYSCFATISLAVSPFIMPSFNMYTTFDPMWRILRIIRRSLLVCIASTSHFLNAISLAIAGWGSVSNLFRPLGQGSSSFIGARSSWLHPSFPNCGKISVQNYVCSKNIPIL